MDKNYKDLYEASEHARKVQNAIIDDQKKVITTLQAENQHLKSAIDKLSNDYHKALSICDSQQELLDRIFREHPEL